MRPLFFALIILSLAVVLGFFIIPRDSYADVNTADFASNAFTVQNWSKAMENIELVAMTAFGTSRYAFDEAGTTAWAHLLPSDQHTIHMKDHQNRSQVFTVTLFHQLGCLKIFRQEYMSNAPPSLLVRHCLNYFRQQILCHMNLRLESAKSAVGQSSRQYDMVCRDWSRIYDEADKYQALMGNQSLHWEW
ncbi:hypothetical protein C8J56DRAFT_827768 [Mycena floridula]|nr:hypothetical protein C8J56DRAFT_827768 [Mycena floridula]